MKIKKVLAMCLISAMVLVWMYRKNDIKEVK